MLWINLALAIIGVTATLSAFGGETWTKGEKPLLTRITRRGWLSLFCLAAVFVLGAGKEILQQRAATTLASERLRLEKENRDQSRQIAEQVERIAALQAQLGRAAAGLSETTDQIGRQQLASIETAFSIAVKAPRETDDAVVNVYAAPRIRIPSRFGEQMLLYWGDEFHFTFIPNEVAPARLATLSLDVGGHQYPLHDGHTTGFFERTIRVYGNTPTGMPAWIVNPDGVGNVSLKIFVRTTDSSQGQSEFRRLILTSPFSEFAKKRYKVTTTPILNVRATPVSSAAIRSRLAKGSFVRVLQAQEGWIEVLTPEGRQGWVESQYLGEIK